MIFNEDKLQEEIIKTWGEFGVHNEVFNTMRKQISDLVKALKDANNLINKYVPEDVADSPQVWNIVSVLERNGVKANSLLDNLI